MFKDTYISLKNKQTKERMQNLKDINIPSKNRQTKESRPPRHRHTFKKKIEENKTPRHKHTPKKQIEIDFENQTKSQTYF